MGHMRYFVDDDAGLCYVIKGKLGRDTGTCRMEVVKLEFSNIEPSGLAGKRILIADDMAVNRIVVTHLLEPSGAELIEAKDGKEAVEAFLARQGKIDLILMDITMPNMDGYEAARAIRSSGLAGAENVPIIAMTAHTDRADADAAIGAGMDSHLWKPIEPDRLFSIVSGYLV
jgi:CheY-like chemotaxis protein